MVDFTRSPRELELEERTQRFIREVVIPYESDPRLAHGISDEIVREMRAKARAASDETLPDKKSLRTTQVHVGTRTNYLSESLMQWICRRFKRLNA